MVGAWLPHAGRPWIVGGEEEQLVERLWNEGLSAAAISEQMGGSRIPSVVLNHLRVMERRGTKFKFSLDSHAGSDVISRRFKALRLLRVDGWVPPPSPRLSMTTKPVLFIDLPRRCCKFPVDDPRPGVYFCAEPVQLIGDHVPAYCPNHHAVAFRGADTTRIRPQFP